MSRPKRRLVAQLLVILVAASATAATSPALPTASDELDFSVALSAETPVASRRVDVSIQHGGNRFGDADLVITGKDWEPSEALWVSLLPLDATEELGWSSGYTSVYAQRQLTEECRADCNRSYAIVVRLRDPAAPALSADIHVEVISRYEGEGADAPAGARADVSLSDESVGVVDPASIRTVVHGDLLVSDQQRVDVWRGLLTVPPATFGEHAELGFPIIGRALLSGSASETGEWPYAGLDLEIGTGQYGFGSPSSEYPMEPIELDWLAECTSGSVCELPVTATMRWEPTANENGQEPTGSVRFNFELEFRLEYLDRTELPADATMEFRVE